jgi:hypothetical protein
LKEIFEEKLLPISRDLRILDHIEGVDMQKNFQLRDEPKQILELFEEMLFEPWVVGEEK